MMEILLIKKIIKIKKNNKSYDLYNNLIKNFKKQIKSIMTKIINDKKINIHKK